VADPTVNLVNGYNLNDDDEPLQEAIFSNYNDNIELDCDSKSLVGRTDPERGLAQKITPQLPLELTNDQRLKITDEYQLALQSSFQDIETALTQLTEAFHAEIARLKEEMEITGNLELGGDLISSGDVSAAGNVYAAGYLLSREGKLVLDEHGTRALVWNAETNRFEFVGGVLSSMGVTDGSVPQPGEIGEALAASAVPINSRTGSISVELQLPAGHWEASANIWGFTQTNFQSLQVQAWNPPPTVGPEMPANTNLGAMSNFAWPPAIYALDAPTTVRIYASWNANQNVTGNQTFYCSIIARRIR
jgi:hypothetical protein